MKLPLESLLSREQKEAIFAPTEKTMLVTGPPGSGKTVIAILREKALRKAKKQVQTLAYNNVLVRYTGLSDTFRTWLAGWWKKSTGERFPTLREAGTTLPSLDFVSAVKLATGRLKSAIVRSGNWGHLILDEAQDYAKDAHSFFHIVSIATFDDPKSTPRPSATILADENQRITTTNSTLEDIRSAHGLAAEDEYKLRENYRNTREIAAFAATFYTGLPSGIPDLPTRRRGDVPRVVITRDVNDAVDRIVTFVTTRPKESHGVLVHYTNTRKTIFNKLQHRLRNTGIRVQTYGGGFQDAHRNSDDLDFAEGHVTVLCFASAKGLEFDNVFIPEAQTIPVNEGHETNAKMNLYVMCSRATKHLWILISDAEKNASLWRILPGGTSGSYVLERTDESSRHTASADSMLDHFIDTGLEYLESELTKQQSNDTDTGVVGNPTDVGDESDESTLASGDFPDEPVQDVGSNTRRIGTAKQTLGERKAKREPGIGPSRRRRG